MLQFIGIIILGILATFCIYDSYTKQKKINNIKFKIDRILENIDNNNNII